MYLNPKYSFLYFILLIYCNSFALNNSNNADDKKDDFEVNAVMAPPLNPNAIVKSLTCYGSNDGNIMTNIQGGDPFTSGEPYTVVWTGPNGFSSTQASISNLSPGDYQLLITDSIGMSLTESYTIFEPWEMIVVTDLKEDITCFGASDGVIHLSASGGTGVYSYTWTRNNLPFSAIEDLTNLSPGNYEVSVTDINNCNPVVMTYTILEPDSLEITLISQTDIKCFGDSTGGVSVNVTGGKVMEIFPGIFDYKYQWTGPAGFTSYEKDLINVPAGIYHLTVMDYSRCTQEFSVTITQPEELFVTLVTTPITCYGANNATITLQIEGGLAPYIARWNNLANGIFQNNLSAGDYTVTVTDANNCAKVITLTIPEAPIFRIAPVVKNITCYGANDGSITLNYDGMGIPTTLTWSDNSGSGTTRNNLGPGTYTVVLDRGVLCQIRRTFVITEPLPLVISSVVRNASACDNINSGAVNILVAGGTQPYRYNWSNGDITEDLSNIPAGSYTVNVTDRMGCTITGEYQVTRPLPIDMDMVSNINFDCNSKRITAINQCYLSGGIPPYRIKWSYGNVNDQNPAIMETSQSGYVTISVTDTVGCTAEKTFNIQVPRQGIKHDVINCNLHFNQFEAFVIDETANYTYLWDFGDGTGSDLRSPAHTYSAPGNYKVSLRLNADLCTSIYEENILVEYPPEVVIDRDPKFCMGDSLLLYALGADSYKWNDGSTEDSLWIKNPGQYSVTGTSYTGCTNTYNFTASYYDSMNYTISSDISEVTNDQNIVHFQTENIPYSNYNWDFGDSLSSTGSDVYHTYEITRDGNFEVKLKVINPYGCMEETQKSISISLTSFANTFTPNGDGYNDIYLKGWQIEIYNRNGILLYKGHEGWDGKHNGKPVSNDTYFVIIYDSTFKGVKYKKNYVTVLR